MNENIQSTIDNKNGKGVLARIDSYCGYCKKEIKSTFKVCPYCKATLLLDIDYDGMDRYAKEYYLSKL